MLGIAPDQAIEELISILQNGDTGQLVTLLNSFKEQGYQAGQIAKQLAGRLRQYLLDGQAPIPTEQVTPTLQKLLDIPTAHDQEAALELIMLDLVLSQNPLSVVTAPVLQTPPKAPEPVKQKPKAAEPPQKGRGAKVEGRDEPEEPGTEPDIIPTPPGEKSTKISEKKPTSKSTTQPSTLNPQPLSPVLWDQALQSIKSTHNTLYSVARMAVPHIDGDELTLAFGFAFHQKRINETKNKQVIADIMEKIAGRPITITCTIDQTATSAPPMAAAISPPVAATTTSNTISTISNIFGSAELLES
jgi:DNA polymerase III gamma/tau subunit